MKAENELWRRSLLNWGWICWKVSDGGGVFVKLHGVFAVERGEKGGARVGGERFCEGCCVKKWVRPASSTAARKGMPACGMVRLRRGRGLGSEAV